MRHLTSLKLDENSKNLPDDIAGPWLLLARGCFQILLEVTGGVVFHRDIGKLAIAVPA